MALTVVDPITVVLLGLRRRVGIVLALVVIVADIVVNWTVFVTIPGSPLFGVMNLTGFAVVLLTTAPLLSRWFSVRGGESQTFMRKS